MLLPTVGVLRWRGPSTVMPRKSPSSAMLGAVSERVPPAAPSTNDSPIVPLNSGVENVSETPHFLLKKVLEPEKTPSYFWSGVASLMATNRPSLMSIEVFAIPPSCLK